MNGVFKIQCRYLCHQKKVRFDTATHLWKDDADYVFDTMWQSIYDTVRDGVKGTLHPYFYRLGYYGLLLAKALILGMPAELMTTSVQMQVLLAIETLMLVTFAVSCLPFAAVVMNVVQPFTHMVNMAVYAMIVFYDDGTGCQFNDTIQNAFIGLTATASALPLVGLAARFIEIRVRVCLHNRKLAEAKRLEDMAVGQSADTNDSPLVDAGDGGKLSEDECEGEEESDVHDWDPGEKLSSDAPNTPTVPAGADGADPLAKSMKRLMKVINQLLEDRDVEAKVEASDCCCRLQNVWPEIQVQDTRR